MIDAMLREASSRETMLAVIADALKDEEKLIFRDVKHFGTSGPGDFRVMQWNMLAQALAVSDDNFLKCPPEALDWSKRRLYVVQEILQYDPDIVCLEEVDNYQFIDDCLSKLGYDSFFRSKVDSPCNYVTPNYGPDGCALFWKTEKIELIDKTSFILAPDNAYINQVALFATFKIADMKFGVLGTHMKAKNGYEELRHAQGTSVLEYLKKNAVGLPLVICGDFNASPDELVYKDFELSELNLLSTYTKLSENGTEPYFTTWKIRAGNTAEEPPGEVCRTLDYIWCTKDNLEVVGIVRLPSEAQVGEHRLPSRRYPSDHLSLIVDFKIGSNL